MKRPRSPEQQTTSLAPELVPELFALIAIQGWPSLVKLPMKWTVTHVKEIRSEERFEMRRPKKWFFLKSRKWI